MRSLTQYLDPDVVRSVSRLDLRARFIVEGFLAGLHRSPFSGLSVEFREHRKYVAGDDPRSIDWNVFARTDRLFVRKFEAETHLACHLLVDASASMGAVGETSSHPLADAISDKLLYAIHLAAALGYLVIRQQDAVGLGVIGDGLVDMLPARSRRGDLATLLARLAAVKPAGETNLAAGIQAALQRIPHRGVIVVLSDLLTEPESLKQALHAVRFRGHDLIVLHILDRHETHFDFEGPLQLEDPETGARLSADADGVRRGYVAALEQWRTQLHDEITALKADYLPLDTSMPFDKALIEFLIQRSKRR